MTPAFLLRQTAKRFREAGVPDPETDSALLLSFLCGKAPLPLRLDTETELSPALLENYEMLAQRRLAREPLQYITGEAPFLGRIFRTDPRVLIPRPETEELCRWMLECFSDGVSADVLDLCCGSGCIGISLAAERPAFRVTLSDISGDALAVASENASRLGVKVSFHCGNLTAGLPASSFDCIISNPPYIPSRDCLSLQPEVLREPLLALDGGADGLDFYRRIATETLPLLRPGSHLFLETGIHESDAVSSLLSSAGFASVEIQKDFNGIQRMIHAITNNPEDLCSRS